MKTHIEVSITAHLVTEDGSSEVSKTKTVTKIIDVTTSWETLLRDIFGAPSAAVTAAFEKYPLAK